MAAVCRLLSRLNGHKTYEGSFAHFSYDLGDGTYLSVPADIPFAAMRASHILVVDAKGTILKGEGFVDPERFQAFNQLRHSGNRPYPMLLFTHTTFTDRLAQHGARIRMVSQSSFNFADEAYSYFDAWGHTLVTNSDFTRDLSKHVAEDDKVFVMLSHGGCIARGEDAAHVFALVHGIDAAAEIQVYAEMTGFPLAEFSEERVKTFPRHGYGDMRGRTKRMIQAFAANKRLLLVDWNQGARNTGDSAFVL
jgi:ribulose-5-phosphate 4-epimerase/fuculose-1-phosphate aldolase